MSAPMMPAISDRFRDLRTRPYTDYFVHLMVVAMLTFIGVVMVMSSSMTWSIKDGNGVWTSAIRQIVMVFVGIVAMWVAMRVRPFAVARFADAILGVSFILLVAVLIPGIGTGLAEVGSQSWISYGPVSFQPSEIARIGVAVWGAKTLGSVDLSAPGGFRRPESKRFFIVSLLMAMLIAAERDLGMTMTFLIVVFALLFFAGISTKFLLWMFGGLGAFMLVVVPMIGGFRAQRFTVYFDALLGHFNDTRGHAYQSYQGFLSLADGSLLGVGIGQSRAKWFYLPEAKNDFIFAVIGEELGFVGGALVIALFLMLAVVGFRIAKRSGPRFLRLLVAALTASVVVQAFTNIGYVVGLLPVTGIQLPMISAGGTSAIITLTAMGLVANCARHEPEAISAMQSHGRPQIDKMLGLAEPSLTSSARPQAQAPQRHPVQPSKSSAAEHAGSVGTQERARNRVGQSKPRGVPAPGRDAREGRDVPSARDRRGSRQGAAGQRWTQERGPEGQERRTGSLNNRSRHPYGMPPRDQRRRP